MEGPQEVDEVFRRSARLREQNSQGLPDLVQVDGDGAGRQADVRGRIREYQEQHH